MSSSAPSGKYVPRKIVYFWDSEYPWDIRVQKICQSLTDAGYAVVILARNRKGDVPTESVAEGTILRMDAWRLLGKKLDSALSFPVFFNPRWLHFLWRVIRAEKPDAVIVRDLPLSVTAAWVCRLFKVPVVLDMAENYPAMIQLIWDTGRAASFDRVVRNPKAVAAVERYVLPKMSRVWVDVEEQGDRLTAMNLPAMPPMDVVRNTPPVARIGPERLTTVERTDVALEVVYLGILELQRGVAELLDAVAMLKNRNVKVRLIVIGSGRDEELFRQQAERLKLGADSVQFLGFLPNNDAVARVALADVGANPIHRNEKHDTTLPNKLFDYMAAGIPVLTSDSTPSARVVRDYACGEVFKSGDAKDLAEALIRLVPGSRRVALGRAGQMAVRKEFHWERDAENVLASINAVANSK